MHYVNHKLKWTHQVNKILSRTWHSQIIELVTRSRRLMINDMQQTLNNKYKISKEPGTYIYRRREQINHKCTNIRIIVEVDRERLYTYLENSYTTVSWNQGNVFINRLWEIYYRKLSECEGYFGGWISLDTAAMAGAYWMISQSNGSWRGLGWVRW